MRLTSIFLTMFFLSTGLVTSATLPLQQFNTNNLIDPIVTGKRVTKAQHDKWLAERERALECPTCVQVQPFPGDTVVAAD